MNIENLLESVGSGLRKIGCTDEKRKLIMRVLMNSHVLHEMNEILRAEQKVEEDYPCPDENEDDSALMQEIEFTDLLDKLEQEHKLGFDNKPFAYDITYPKSVKNDT